MSRDYDPEKAPGARRTPDEGKPHVNDASIETKHRLPGWAHKALTAARVEERGIRPVPLEERTSSRSINVLTIWLSMNANILPITFGMFGPLFYGLNLRDSCLIILFFTLLCTMAPAYLSTMGPKTGMRQMIQARFSFGRYLVAVPVVLNLATLTGFIVIICVVGGQCLSAVTDGSLTPNAGIIIIALLSLLISFCGFRVLHLYEGYAWIPAIVAIIIATGCGGKHLGERDDGAGPATAAAVLNFGMIVASYMIPWAALASDITTYFDPKVPSWRIFLYSYLGLILPTIPLMCLGASIGVSISHVPSWSTAYDTTLVGGVLSAMLSPAGGFGGFVTVVLALSLLGNAAGTMYAVTLNLQTLIPWLLKVPRYVFAVVVTAVVIPVAIAAARDFFLNLENFVALIAYWSAAFVSIVVCEDLVFKRRRYELYDHSSWDVASRLPSGLAALGAGVLSFGLVIPCMAQVWWTGPIAKETGDIGFEMAFALSAVLYVPLRFLERKLLKR